MSNRLSDILANVNRDSLAQAFDAAKPAGDFVPLPAGEYVAHIVSGECFTSRQNETPGYKLTFKVIEGEYAGRQVWHDIWLTPAAMPMAKRDLGKLGITTLDQLDRPLRQGIRCRVRVTVRQDDGQADYNRVRSFDVLGVDTPGPDPFAPAAQPAATPSPRGEADEAGLPAKAVTPDDGIPI
ncbi:MAG: hypothetical protein BIFFINMI_01974 [Phycisphaerae bacterium]|nr:hypothetical protein [Phycisphaerae bacterium]